MLTKLKRYASMFLSLTIAKEKSKMTKTEKTNGSLKDRVYNFVSFWLIMTIAGVLMFFGAMWFTNGSDIVVRYAASGVITLLILEKLFQRLK